MSHTFVYVSNALDGDIGIYRLHDGGTLEPLGRASAAPAVGPLAISPDRRFLYAASRAQPCALHAYAIDPATGALNRLSSTPAVESFPYIMVDRSGRFLLAASYFAHLVAVYPLGADGRPAPQALQVLPVGRNAHSIRVDETNRYAYVPTLGSDQVFQFLFDADSGRLASNTPAIAPVPPGTGPRHGVTSSDNRFLYVVNEMLATVSIFALDGATGLLTLQGSVSGLPPDTPLVPGAARGAPAAAGGPPPRDTSRDIWAADIHLTPDGRFLYISERTSSTIGAYRVDRETGGLTWLANTPTEAQPRGFAIDPSGRYLVASGEKSDMVTVHAIDPATGALTALGRSPAGRGATWVEIVTTGAA